MSGGFQTTVAFPNGLMWLMSQDDKQVEIPDIDGVANFWVSHNTWGICAQHEADGEVQVSISGSPPHDPSLALLHQGVLHSNRQLIEVQTVYVARIPSFRIRTTDVPISIWGDDPGSKSESTSSARASTGIQLNGGGAAVYHAAGRLSRAARDLMQSSDELDGPADSYSVIGNVLDTVRSLEVVLGQLAEWAPFRRS